MDVLETVSVGTAEEADRVVDYMKHFVEIYGLLTLAEFYALVGVKASFNDYKVGWRDLSELRVIYSKGEYTFDLPDSIIL